MPSKGSRRGGRRPRHTGVALAALVALLAVVAVWAVREARRPGPWQRVYATREGLVGRRTASGHIIAADSLFVALPHRSALGRLVEIRYRGRSVIVPVLDVGPWNIDDEYWTSGRRPASERGKGTYRKPTNQAGIDLSDAVFARLGLEDNDHVEWRFVHRGYVILPGL